MGGMILKDFIFMKKQIKFYLLVIGIYCVLCFYWDQASLVVTMACVLSIMFPVQIFGWDESCNWQMMERILPVSSGKVVLARYLSAFLMSLVSMGSAVLIMNVVYMVKGQPPAGDTMLFHLMVCAAVVLVETVMIPVIYRFGSANSRLMLVLIIGAVAAIVYLCGKVTGPLPVGELAGRLPYLIIGAAVICLVPSYLISIAVYRKKEY